MVKKRDEAVPLVNKLIGEFSDLVVGRIGLPHRARHVSVIGLIVEATTDQVGSLTGKLGMIEGVKVKSLMV